MSKMLQARNKNSRDICQTILEEGKYYEIYDASYGSSNSRLGIFKVIESRGPGDYTCILVNQTHYSPEPKGMYTQSFAAIGWRLIETTEAEFLICILQGHCRDS